LFTSTPETGVGNFEDIFMIIGKAQAGDYSWII
jgi:hypothetical protein